jgi:hypothetical protein
VRNGQLVMVYVLTKGAKKEKCKVDNCNNNRKNNGLFRKHGANIYVKQKTVNKLA